MNSSRSGLILGYPFDQLLDRTCPLEHWRNVDDSRFPPGIKLPTEKRPGTGNIVISGPPGSGKSTLALQWAVRCAMSDANQSNAAYISLENTVDQVISKGRAFGWEKWLREVNHFTRASEAAGADVLGGELKKILTLTRGDVVTRTENEELTPENLRRRVLLCSLSPRTLTADEKHHDIFWRRYQQLEQLLSAADRISPAAALPEEAPEKVHPGWIELPLVVIDSLNMFGARPLTRDEIYCIFGLFHKYRRVGVFVVESTAQAPFDSTMADVVISLSADKDRGYHVHYFEIEKSRYYNQINGLHPYKSTSDEKDEQHSDRVPPLPHDPERPKRRQDGIVVYPSLHYIVLRTETTTRARKPVEPPLSRDALEEDDNERKKYFEPAFFGLKAMGTIWPRGFHGKEQRVVVVEGERGTFKTNLALNFLLNGLRQNESGLLIRLGDSPLIGSQDGELDRPRCMKLGHRLSQALREPVSVFVQDPGGQRGIVRPFAPFISEEWIEADAWPPQRGKWSALAGSRKAAISAWRHCKAVDMGPPAPGVPQATLFEIDFKGGMLLAEEMVEVLRGILIRRPFKRDGEALMPGIRRVVLDDISLIGISYPLLKRSKTTGDVFLPALVHILRNAGVDLVITGTTGGPAEADEIVNRACALADTVLSCRFRDVFGQRRIVVGSEGLLADAPELEHSRESVPGVVHLHPEGTIFDIDTTYLEGLVGFDTDRLHRPGVVMHFFEGVGGLGRKYNEEIERMISTRLALGKQSFDSLRPTRPGIVRGARSAIAAGNARGAQVAKPGLVNSEPGETFEVADVALRAFNSRESESIHDSFDLLRGGSPLDKTLLFTVDEFATKYGIHAVKRRITSSDDERAKTWIRLPDPNVDDEDSAAASLNWNDLIHFKKWGKLSKASVWPYYANVLLIAYRNDWAEKTSTGIVKSFASWQDVLKLAEEMAAKTGFARRGKAAGGKTRKRARGTRVTDGIFAIDCSARETLSCLLLDALLKGKTGPGKRTVAGDPAFLEPAPPDAAAREKRNNELAAVVRLLGMLPGGNYANDPKDTLGPDAGIYVCWYSHLRQLIEEHSHLASTLTIAALPAGGFRGDWFLGVLNGSVSPALGGSIIEKLCSKEEDYKRFLRGVGLPTRLEFYSQPAERDVVGRKYPERKVQQFSAGSDFPMWPGALGLPLSEMFEILEQAHWRMDISEYQKIRSTVFATAESLTRLGQRRCTDEQLDEAITALIEPFFHHVALLRRPRNLARGQKKPKPGKGLRFREQ